MGLKVFEHGVSDFFLFEWVCAAFFYDDAQCLSCLRSGFYLEWGVIFHHHAP